MRDIKKYAENYDLRCKFEDYQIQYRRRKIIEFIDEVKPNKVLEIGCGREPLFFFLSRDISWTIVEPATSFCEKVREIALKDKRKNVTVIRGFFEEKCDFLTEKYDMIICSSLLHEVENPSRLLKSIFNVAEEETLIHINVPNAKSMHRLLALEAGLIKSEFDKSENNILYQQNTNFDLESLQNLVERCGGKVVERGSYFIKPFTHEQMAKLLDLKVIEPEVIDGFYGMIKYMPTLGSEIFVNCRKV